MSQPTDPLSQIRLCMEAASPATRVVGEWILRYPAQAATLGIEEIAARSGPSTATVNRLARAAGFAGFAPMKAALLQGLRDAVDSIQKIQGQQSNKEQVTLANHVQLAMANLEELGRLNTQADFARAGDMLAQARRIYVLGMGVTANLAGWFVDALSSYLPHVVNLAHSGGTERCAARLSRIAEGQVLVVISLPRYSKDAISLAGYAKQRGAQVLAIADLLAAPLLRQSHHHLIAPAAHALFPSSYVAAQLICESLVTEVVCREPGAAQSAASLTDAVLSHLAFSPRR